MDEPAVVEENYDESPLQVIIADYSLPLLVFLMGTSCYTSTTLMSSWLLSWFMISSEELLFFTARTSMALFSSSRGSEFVFLGGTISIIGVIASDRDSILLSSKPV